MNTGEVDRMKRLQLQRDRAWRALAHAEFAMGWVSATDLKAILAAGHGPDDSEEWNAVMAEAKTIESTETE